VLDSLRLEEQKADEERKAKEEAERLAMLKIEEERLTREKAEAERKAKEEAERLAFAKAQQEAAEREAIRLKAEREEAELAVRQAGEKAAKEKAEKEAAEREADRLQAEQETAREKDEREAAIKAEREAAKLAARKKAEREAAQRAEEESIAKARAEAASFAGEKAVTEHMSSDKVIPVPKWSDVFQIALGWGICGAIIHAINSAGVSYLITNFIGGAISGLIVGLTLWAGKLISNKKSILGLTFGLALSVTILAASGGFGFVFAIIWGIIDGLIVSSILWLEKSLSNRVRIVWITLGWSIGYFITYSIPFTIIGNAISGALSGAVCGFVLIWQMRSERIQAEKLTRQSATKE
jgi:hypothetical protein